MREQCYACHGLGRTEVITHPFALDDYEIYCCVECDGTGYIGSNSNFPDDPYLEEYGVEYTGFKISFDDR